MKSFRSLLQVLNKEAKLQEKLLTLLVEERSQIVHLHREELEKLAAKKEVVLSDLQELKYDRKQVFQTIIAGLNLETKAPKLSEAVAHCKDVSLQTDLTKRSESLKELALNVQALNQENGVLLKQSLGLISSTISIITARPQTSNTSYGRNAKVASDEETENTIVSSFNRSV